MKEQLYRIVPSKNVKHIHLKPMPNYGMSYDDARRHLRGKVVPCLQIYYHILPVDSLVMRRYNKGQLGVIKL